FHLLTQGEELIDKESIMKSLEDIIFLKNHNGSTEMYNNWYKKTEEKIKNLKLEIETLKNEKEKFADNINKINNGIDLLSSSKEYNEYLTLDTKYNRFKDELNEKS
ncbi:hypothetical protein, partial [Clostridium sp. HCS.1]|uniref:hypothetical protein n=1 Tax=Clostridium sp. HCS.1 TaxID=3238594 RepID=UPI003A0FE016